MPGNSGYDQNGVPIGQGGGTGTGPYNPDGSLNKEWLRAHGFNPDTFGKNPTGGTLPPGWIVNPRTGGLLPPGTSATGGGGIPIGALFDMNGTIFRWDGHTMSEVTAKADVNRYWAQHPNGLTYNSYYGLIDPSQGPGDTGMGVGGYSSGGGGAGADMRPREFDDPRYWDLQYQQLYQQAINNGLDANAARQQALAGLLANRNNNAVQLADIAGQQAKVMADYAANPRDAVAELQYRNLVGGVPFGDVNNPAFPQYQTALQNKAQALFGPQQQAFSQAQNYVNSPPPLEYLSPETRGQLGKPQGVTLPNVSFSGQQAAQPDLSGLVGFSPEQTQQLMAYNKARGFSEGGTINVRGLPIDRRNYSTGNVAVGGFSQGGNIDFTPQPQLASGYRPSSSEGGTNMNIHEPSVVVGAKSGHIYATLAENAPEQMIIKPLPSVVKAQREQEKQGKQQIKQFAEGGTINFGQDPSEFIKALREQLGGLGGPRGGVGGFSTQLPSPRLLANAPWQQISNDPVLQDYLAAGYSAMGIDPRSVEAAVRQYTPRGIIGNSPRVSFA